MIEVKKVERPDVQIIEAEWPPKTIAVRWGRGATCHIMHPDDDDDGAMCGAAVHGPSNTHPWNIVCHECRDRYAAWVKKYKTRWIVNSGLVTIHEVWSTERLETIESFATMQEAVQHVDNVRSARLAAAAQKHEEAFDLAKAPIRAHRLGAPT